MMVPPFPHPLPERRISVAATSNGLLLSGARSTILLDWGTAGTVTTLPYTSISEPVLTVYGVVGTLRLFNRAYVFLLTSRKQIATYLTPNRPVYCCTGVLAVPLEKEEVDKVLAKQAATCSSSAAENDDEQAEDQQPDALDEVETPAPIARQSFFETVKPGKARPWASRLKRSASHTDPDPDPALQPEPEPETESVQPTAAADHPLPLAEDEYLAATRLELEEKVVKETAKHFARGEFWFAYDVDVTTPLQRKLPHDSATPDTALNEPNPHLPLWRRVDSRFWHNQHMATDLIRAGANSFILPLMQGYFQSVSLPLSSDTDSNSNSVAAQLLVISRRSKERAGLRYQRRGINQDGQVANFVETEQILHLPATNHTLAFLQIRGSIPLFWSQSPFSLKPPPVLERSKDENLAAAKTHFAALCTAYSPITCINLAEQKGKEGAISHAYRDTVAALNDPQVRYEDFDFHSECAGMKFENVRLTT